MFNKLSAFGQEKNLSSCPECGWVISGPHHCREQFTSQNKKSGEDKKIPFEHWHHDLVTIDILLDQKPPEIERARSLLLEVSDEIHSQFEGIK